MFKLAKAAFAATLATVVVASQSFAADPIRIPLHNWTSQLVGAEIVGRILQKGGSEVEYVPADSGAVYEAMCEGDIDLVHLVVEPNPSHCFACRVTGQAGVVEQGAGILLGFDNCLQVDQVTAGIEREAQLPRESLSLEPTKVDDASAAHTSHLRRLEFER